MGIMLQSLDSSIINWSLEMVLLAHGGEVIFFRSRRKALNMREREDLTDFRTLSREAPSFGTSLFDAILLFVATWLPRLAVVAREVCGSPAKPLRGMGGPPLNQNT